MAEVVQCPLGKDNTSAPEHCLAVNNIRSQGRVGLCLGCVEDPVELLIELLQKTTSAEGILRDYDGGENESIEGGPTQGWLNRRRAFLDDES